MSRYRAGARRRSRALHRADSRNCETESGADRRSGAAAALDPSRFLLNALLVPSLTPMPFRFAGGSTTACAVARVRGARESRTASCRRIGTQHAVRARVYAYGCRPSVRTAAIRRTGPVRCSGKTGDSAPSSSPPEECRIDDTGTTVIVRGAASTPQFIRIHGLTMQFDPGIPKVRRIEYAYKPDKRCLRAERFMTCMIAPKDIDEQKTACIAWLQLIRRLSRDRRITRSI